MSHYLWLEKKRDASWLLMVHEFDLGLINNSPAVRKTPTGYTDFGDDCWWLILLFRAPISQRRSKNCHQHKKCHQLNPASLLAKQHDLDIKNFTEPNDMIFHRISEMLHIICCISYATESIYSRWYCRFADAGGPHP